MASEIERLIRKTTGLLLHQAGDISLQVKEPKSLISTRPYLFRSTYKSVGERPIEDVRPPQVISCDGVDFVVDGHHSLRHAIENGILEVECAVLTTKLPLLQRELKSMATGPIGQLEMPDSAP